MCRRRHFETEVDCLVNMPLSFFHLNTHTHKHTYMHMRTFHLSLRCLFSLQTFESGRTVLHTHTHTHTQTHTKREREGEREREREREREIHTHTQTETNTQSNTLSQTDTHSICLSAVFSLTCENGRTS